MGELLAGGPSAPAPKRVAVARPAPKPANPTYSIQVINGASSTEEKFNSPEGQH
jgi:hypothetical protein